MEENGITKTNVKVANIKKKYNTRKKPLETTWTSS